MLAVMFVLVADEAKYRCEAQTNELRKCAGLLNCQASSTKHCIVYHKVQPESSAELCLRLV